MLIRAVSSWDKYRENFSMASSQHMVSIGLQDYLPKLFRDSPRSSIPIVIIYLKAGHLFRECGICDIYTKVLVSY